MGEDADVSFNYHYYVTDSCIFLTGSTKIPDLDKAFK